MQKILEKAKFDSKPGLLSAGIDVLLLVFSALLFALSFPNFLYHKGFFPLGFICLAPAFIAIHRSRPLAVPLYGALFGYLSYFLFNFWLMKFHPLAIIIVPFIYSLYFFLFFPVLKLLDHFFPKYGYLLQALVWVVFEYIRTTGFLGYSYGVLGYSQYPFLPLIRISEITGVWGVVLLVIIPSVYLARIFQSGGKALKQTFARFRLHGLVYGICFVLVLSYGFLFKADTRGSDTWRVALIQQNGDPWKDGYIAYGNVLNKLISLSDQALEEKPEIVIWSETSFVPAIEYHQQFREIREAYTLVKRLVDYVGEQEVPFLVGNDEGMKIMIGTPDARRIDYNSALLFKGREITQRYRKKHLVPFTEHFPYEKQFPGIYKLLKEADTHFWEKGKESTIFESGGVRFATPICFEDTFGYLCREFVDLGADVLVNMTNDSWSESVVAEEQHMSIAVFRAVENRRAMVRSSNGGITCTIEPDGRILKRLPPFEEGYLVADIPVYKGGKTLYTLWGDWFPVVVAVIFSVLIFLILLFRKKRIDKT